MWFFKKWKIIKGKKSPDQREDLQSKNLFYKEDYEQKPEVPLQIHLGFDYGTVWTKVAYRVLNQEYSGDVPFYKGSTNYIRSRVYVDNNEGTLHSEDFTGYSDNKICAWWTPVDYLKIRIYKKDENSFEFKAASFFLSRIIRSTREIIQKELLNDKKASIEWSASLGIPTEHKNSQKEKIYTKLLNTAWFLSELWDQSSIDPIRLNELIGKIDNADNSIPLYIMPELQANIFALTHGPAVPDGIYALFDIGGGTLDGSFFRLERNNGTRQVEVIKAIVEPYGCEVIKQQISEIYSEKNILFSTSMIEEILNYSYQKSSFDPRKKSFLTDPIYKNVAEIVHNGRQATINDPWWNLKKLNIILCGGGSFYKWYCMAIEYTYIDRNLKNCGIPKFERFIIPEPGEDFQYNSIKKEELPRFFLAYGLSFPEEEHHRVIGFPEHYHAIIPNKRDIKSESSERLNDWYGEAEV